MIAYEITSSFEYLNWSVQNDSAALQFVLYACICMNYTIE
jgi:hypothetical protein